MAKCYVLSERSDSYYGAGVGFLSIKSFWQGEAFYTVGATRFRVTDAAYLVLNHGQEYTITIDAPKPVESFCLFFDPGFAEEVYAASTRACAYLLDHPDSPIGSFLHFFEKTYRHDQIVSPYLHQLRLHYPTLRHEPNWLQENAYALMQRLLMVHHEIQHEAATLPAMRATTRTELYRRLHWARDYIAASYELPLTLDEMAKIACLSTNHFLRSFKQLFHITPHQYLTQQRLAQACNLLQQSNQSITEICFAVGFQSVGSFSWLFRRRIGCTPEQYRQQKR